MDGDILVFLTGQEEIETANEILAHRTKVLGNKIAELVLVSCHTSNTQCFYAVVVFNIQEYSCGGIIFSAQYMQTYHPSSKPRYSRRPQKEQGKLF